MQPADIFWDQELTPHRYTHLMLLVLVAGGGALVKHAHDSVVSDRIRMKFDTIDL